MTTTVEPLRRPSLIRAVVPDNDDEFIEPDGTEYQAFKIGGRDLRRLSLLPVKGAWVHPAYRQYLNVFEDGGHGTGLVLDFTFMAAVITGRNLRPMIAAILRERCAFVQQFDPARWNMPPAKDAPVITGLTLYPHTEKLPPDAWDLVNARR